MKIKKIAVPVNITDTERQELANEGIYLYESATDRLENMPARDVANLAKELATKEPDNDFLKAAKIILTLPRVSFANENLMVEINGKNYYLVDKIEKKKENINKIIGFEVDTGKLVEFNTIEVEDKIKKPKIVQEKTVNEMNKSIAKFNSKIDKLQNSMGFSRIPLQANSAEESIDDRLNELNAQIQSIKSRPKNEFPSYQKWKENEHQKAVNQNLNLTDTIDTLLHKYQSNPQMLKSKLEKGEITVDTKIKNFLISILAEEQSRIDQNKIKDISEQVQREMRQNEEFVPDETLEFDKIKELTVDDIPSSKYKNLTKFKGPESVISQNSIMISEIQRDIDELQAVKTSLANIKQYIGHLESGHRSNAFLRSENGQQAVMQIKSFINDTGRFCKRYKEKPIENGKINSRLFGRQGTLGNALLASELNKFCLTLWETLKSVQSPSTETSTDIPTQANAVGINIVKKSNFESPFWNEFFKQYLK